MVSKVRTLNFESNVCFRTIIFNTIPKENFQIQNDIASFRIIIFNMIPKGAFGITLKTYSFKVITIDIVPKVDFLDMLKN